MSLLMKPLQDLHDWYLRFNYVHPDPRVKGWFLMDSPFTVLLLVTTYLLFVYKLGPTFMKNRKPFNLEKLKIIYNITQIIVLCWLVKFSTPLMFKLNLLCSPVNYSNDPDALIGLKFGWVYYMLKVADLVDTVFIILKKNYRQASFLHVYHHSLMVVLTWACTRYYGGGHNAFLPYINSIVHIIMYSYYLLTTFFKFEKNVWWKKYITQIQLLQFTMLFAIYLPPYFQNDCKYPKFFSVILVPINLSMIVLFSNFYYNTYIKKKTKDSVN